MRVLQRQQFERDFPIELRIMGYIRSPSASLAQTIEHDIAVDDRSGRAGRAVMVVGACHFIDSVAARTCAG